jgi:hypothetical protein
MLQPAAHRGTHYIFTAAGCRVQPTIDVQPSESGIYGVQAGLANAGGDTIFLPYRQNSICPVRLPVPCRVGSPPL